MGVPSMSGLMSGRFVSSSSRTRKGIGENKGVLTYRGADDPEEDVVVEGSRLMSRAVAADPEVRRPMGGEGGDQEEVTRRIRSSARRCLPTVEWNVRGSRRTSVRR